MKIFLLFSIVIIMIFLVVRDVIYAAKRNLLKDKAAWSGKDIKIKYNTSREVSDSKENDNYLKVIAEESKIYLDEHTKNKENEIK